MKNWMLKFFMGSLVLFAAGCGVNPVPFGPPPLTQQQFKQVSTGIYIGGGMLWHPTDQNLNHFSQMGIINIRLSRTMAEVTNGEFEEIVYDTNTGEMISSNISTVMSNYAELKESVVFGKIYVNSLSASQAVLSFELYSADNTWIKHNTPLTLNAGESADLNGDGLMDVAWLPYQMESDLGSKGAYTLFFLSDQEGGNLSMYQCPQDSNYPYPSGIITLNPSGSVISIFDQSTFVSSNNNKLTFNKGQAPMLDDGDYIYFPGTTNMMQISTNLDAGNGKMTYVCEPINVFDAYEIMDLSINTTPQELQNQTNQGIGNFQRANPLVSHTFDIPIPDFKASQTDGNFEWSFVNKNTLKLILEADMTLRWDTVKVDTKIVLQGDISMILEAAYKKNFTKNIAEFELWEIYQFFMIGPVPVTFEMPISAGIDFSAGGYGRFKTGMIMHGEFGMETSAGFGINYKKKTIKVGPFKKTFKIPWSIKNYNSAKVISDYYFHDHRNKPFSPESLMDFSAEGYCTLTPYIEISPGLYIGGIAGIKAGARLNFDNTLKASLKAQGNSLSLDVDYNLSLNGEIVPYVVFKIDLKFWEKTFEKDFGSLKLKSYSLKDLNLISVKTPELPDNYFSLSTRMLDKKNDYSYEEYTNANLPFVMDIVARSSQDLNSVSVNGTLITNFAAGVKQAPVQYILDKSGISGGSNTYTVIATDKSGKSATNRLLITVDRDNINGNSTNFVTGLFVLYGKTALPPAGYTKIGVDLNKGAGGSYIYLCYTKDTSKGMPIRNLSVHNSSSGSHTHATNYFNAPSSYYPTGNGDADLNKGAGGNWIFLHYTREGLLPDGSYLEPIRDIKIVLGKYPTVPAGYKIISSDLNKNAGGEFIWIIYKR